MSDAAGLPTDDEYSIPTRSAYERPNTWDSTNNRPNSGDMWNDRTSYGGQARTYNPDGTVNQQSGADQAVDKYQGLAGAAANRSAYQANYGGYNAAMGQAQGARGSQQDALGLQQQAAYGNAPSAAQIQGQQMINQSLQAQMAGAASARGGSLAQAAAMHNAANGAAAFQQQGIGQLSALRAQEMAQARGDYANTAGAMRSGDYQGAGLGLQQTGQDIQNQQFQRQQNDTQQMGYDKMAQQTNEDEQKAALQQEQIESGNAQHQSDLDEHSTDRETGFLSSLTGAVGSGVGSLLNLSDRRAKRDAVMLSSVFVKDDVSSLTGVPSGDPNVDAVSGVYAEHPPVVFGSSVGVTPADLKAKPSLGAAVPARVGFGPPPTTDKMLNAREVGTRTAPAPWLDAAMTPAPIQRGVLGAPKGYAASRAGQPGAIGEPEFEAPAADPYAGMAPGTADYVHAMHGGASLDGKGAANGDAFAEPPSPGAAPLPGGASAPGKPKRSLGSVIGNFGGSLSQLGNSVFSSMRPTGQTIRSDERAKTGVSPMGGVGNGGLDPYDAAFQRGDFMAPLQKENALVTQSIRRPGAVGPSSGGFNMTIRSDERAKREVTPPAVKAVHESEQAREKLSPFQALKDSVGAGWKYGRDTFREVVPGLGIMGAPGAAILGGAGVLEEAVPESLHQIAKAVRAAESVPPDLRGPLDPTVGPPLVPATPPGRVIGASPSSTPAAQPVINIPVQKVKIPITPTPKSSARESEGDRPVIVSADQAKVDKMKLEWAKERASGEHEAYIQGIAQARAHPGNEAMFYGHDPLADRIEPSETNPWFGNERKNVGTDLPPYVPAEAIKDVYPSGHVAEPPAIWLRKAMQDYDSEGTRSPARPSRWDSIRSTTPSSPATDGPNAQDGAGAPGTEDYIRTMGGGPKLDGAGRGQDFETPSDERLKSRTASLHDPMGSALDAMQPYSYRYKRGVPGEDPDAPQVGPMANPMARDPVASTAIVRDPQTGYLAIDMKNATKLALGGLGYLKDRQDQTDRSLAAIAAKLGARRG